MKIDVWTHILSPAFAAHLEAQGQHYLLENRALRDLDLRFEVMDRFGDYRQVLTPIPGPTIYRSLAGKALIDLVRRNNDEMAEIVAQHPDRFAGFAAATPLADPDAATEEASRVVRDLGALGVQLEEDLAAFPLHEARYEPLLAAMEELGGGVWLHPIRKPSTPGFPVEAAPFLFWLTFAYPFDTTITIARLIFAGIYDRHPRLKVIAHHGGGLIPHLSGRIEMMSWYTGMDPTLGEALQRLEKQPIEYFKMVYVDSAMFGSRHACKCVIDFFGSDHVLFGTDTPFDMRGGAHFIPTAISDVEESVLDPSAREAIFAGNACSLIGARV